jgi:NADPH-dependent 2,4-dienoyl-CoA reductase/sulfur reductase-like enzyme/rhodanese-related sulfurtransferase
MTRKIIVVGGSLSGSAAAARIRSLDAQSEIILLEKEATISSAGTAWPGLLADDTTPVHKQQHLAAEEFRRQYRVDVRVNSEVIAIRRFRRLVEIRPASDVEGKPYKEKYDQLVLATGCVPVRPAAFPPDLEGMFLLKSPTDIQKIRSALSNLSVRRILVVGGTPTGLQAAEALARRGLSVTLLEKSNHVLAALDPDMARVVEGHLVQKGIHLRLGRQPKRIERTGGYIMITLDDDSTLDSDLIILACGLKPDISLAVAAGLKSGPFGTLQTTAGGQTSDKRIFAAGALAADIDLISNKAVWAPTPSSVIQQARRVADQLNDFKADVRPALAITNLELPGLEAGAVGVSENELIALRIDYNRTYTMIPGNEGQPFLIVKILWSRQNRHLLGAQLVSDGSSSERLAQLALAIQARQTVDDLSRLDLPHEPSRPGRRNWLLQAGLLAQNQLRGLYHEFSIYDLASLDTSRVILVDVRSREEFLRGTIPGAINLPFADLVVSLQEGKVNLPPDKPLYLFSDSGRQGYLASRQLMLSGRKDVYNLAGGYWLYSRVIGRTSS